MLIQLVLIQLCSSSLCSSSLCSSNLCSSSLCSSGLCSSSSMLALWCDIIAFHLQLLSIQSFLPRSRFIRLVAAWLRPRWSQCWRSLDAFQFRQGARCDPCSALSTGTWTWKKPETWQSCSKIWMKLHGKMHRSQNCSSSLPVWRNYWFRGAQMAV